MKALIIEPDLLTPRIVLDPGENKFQISERSLPEDALSFYMPVINWLEEYKNSPNPKTHVEFKLEYFNTASSRMLYKVFTTLKEISENSDVLIKWYYSKDDTDMLASGKRFGQLINTPFEFIED
jgi:hypothetical protein